MRLGTQPTALIVKLEPWLIIKYATVAEISAKDETHPNDGNFKLYK